MQTFNWYDFIIFNHFKSKNIKPPNFFTREFIKFKFEQAIFQEKVFYVKNKILNEINNISTKELVDLISNITITQL